MTTFKASLDRTAIGITAAVTILFIAIIGGQLAQITDTEYGLSISIAAFCLLLYLGAFAFHPTKYMLTDQELIICRPVSDVRIPREAIYWVQVIDQEQVDNAIRVFGVGGLFGYYGQYSNFALGSMTWYATRKDNTVLVDTTDNRKIILTPDEPAQFVEAFRQVVSE